MKKELIERTQTTIRLREDLKRLVEHARTERQVESLQAAVEEGLELLLASKVSTTTVGISGSKGDQAKSVATLGVSPIPLPRGLGNTTMKEFINCASNLGRLFETDIRKARTVRDAILGLLQLADVEHGHGEDQRSQVK